MDDRWYEIASLEHPWIVRRFEVLRRLGDSLIQQSSSIAEFGCGHGLLQRQVEDFYHLPVTGFDLNEAALKQTAARSSPVCCYDLLEQRPEYEGRFDLILLFDVLEHIQDEEAFLRALLFHLGPAGRVLINVPAFQSLASAYDRAVGHLRRYNVRSLSNAAQRSGMDLASWTYWGLPLMPLLMLRKLWLAGRSDQHIVSAGFESHGRVMDRMLLWLSRCEPIPQHLVGTSLMGVLVRSF
ncbi:MAG: class I SAM-dependent methyltransferase [Acidobacteriia bacterium]|nr:class I SAM-dependent methyltransferase [Terriglobia bacterium]